MAVETTNAPSTTKCLQITRVTNPTADATYGKEDMTGVSASMPIDIKKTNRDLKTSSIVPTAADIHLRGVAWVSPAIGPATAAPARSSISNG